MKRSTRNPAPIATPKLIPPEPWKVDEDDEPDAEAPPLPEPYTDEYGIHKNHHGGLPFAHWLTPKKYKTIVGWVRRGHYVTTACSRVGITRRVFERWIRLARDPDAHPIYSYLVGDIEKAEARFKDERLAAVHAGEKEDWRAAAWSLGVRFPDQYQEKIKLQVENQLNIQLNAVLTAIEGVLKPEDFDKVLEAVADIRAGETAAALPSHDDGV